eukprot:UN2862
MHACMHACMHPWNSSLGAPTDSRECLPCLSLASGAAKDTEEASDNISKEASSWHRHDTDLHPELPHALLPNDTQRDLELS